jgi:hypothetical protein
MTTLRMPHSDDPEHERLLVEARARLVRAKSRWTRAATDVLRRVATAADVELALVQLETERGRMSKRKSLIVNARVLRGDLPERTPRPRYPSRCSTSLRSRFRAPT